MHAKQSPARALYAIYEDYSEVVSPLSCVAIQSGQDAPFFSEKYFDGSAESHIGRALRTEVQRRQVVELGSLASQGRVGNAVPLLEYVPVLLWEMGYRYVLCTATNYARRILKSAGLNFKALCAADPARLVPGTLQAWGDYYRYDPQTGWFALEAAAAAARQRSFCFLPTLYTRDTVSPCLM